MGPVLHRKETNGDGEIPSIKKCGDGASAPLEFTPGDSDAGSQFLPGGRGRRGNGGDGGAGRALAKLQLV